MKPPKVDLEKLIALREKLVGEFIDELKSVIQIDNFAESHARNIAEYEFERIITERIYEIHLRNETKRIQEEGPDNEPGIELRGNWSGKRKGNSTDS